MRIGIDIGSTTVKVVLLDDQDNILFKTYERHMSKVREKTAEMLRLLVPKLGNGEVQVAITGSAGLGVAKAADLEFVQEVFATAGGVERFIPDADVVVELGGEDAKIIFFTGGLEEETDEALRVRVLETFQRMPNGANAAFYQREALSFPQIAAASVIPRPRGIGTVDVIAATRAGVPDEALLAQLTDHLQSRREIAVEVQVKAPTLSTVTMYLQLKPKEGYTFAQVAAGVKQRLQDWFTGERLGQDILRSELGDLIYHCEGVANYNIVAPKKDVAGSPEVLPQLGRVTTEAMK